jgi:2,3-bisphosphoglycerate-independent phosphoglycerate mutase
MSAAPRNTPLVLVIRDGWGANPNPGHAAFNAVALALTPVSDALERDYPCTLIKTSGEDVGLPEGTMGNSEVGHQNIGAGRIVDQESVAITKACRAGLEKNPVLAGAVSRAAERGRAVHLMGICSDAGVHGLLTHLYALIDLCVALGRPRVFVHLFTDGRDTGPFTGLEFVRQVEVRLGGAGVGRVASVMGRYWAMDRDFRWERVARAYACLSGREITGAGHAPLAASAAQAVQRHYDHPDAENLKGDEYLPPTRIGADEGEASRGRVREGDAVVFYNYRGDRPRELVGAFVLPDAEWAKVKPSPDSGRAGFERGRRLDLEFVTMTAYSESLAPHVRVAFPKPPRMVNIGGEYLSALGLQQFRCAETEKYPHVTFFFNDYRDAPFPGERRENPQSPRVATYDLRPEMSAAEVRDAVLRRLAAPDCEHVLIVNFANADMVGHTGNLAAAIKACEAVDACVGPIVEAVTGRGGSLIVTADHGNAEQMWDPEAEAPHTAHTVYDVPLIVVGGAFKGRRLRGDADVAGWFDPARRAGRGRLADIFPTVLDMMGLPKPPEMTGTSLLIPAGQ